MYWIIYLESFILAKFRLELRVSTSELVLVYGSSKVRQRVRAHYCLCFLAISLCKKLLEYALLVK